MSGSASASERCIGETSTWAIDWGLYYVVPGVRREALPNA